VAEGFVIRPESDADHPVIADVVFGLTASASVWGHG
jgi:hypothetical protein